MFFVGTAPLAQDGHVNVSPKGPGGTPARARPAPRSPTSTSSGSGAETIAHVRENGRIVVMFCAFEGPPRIVRLHGRGEIVLAGDPRFEPLLDEAGVRGADGAGGAARDRRSSTSRGSASSCGYGVPLMDYAGERPHTDASTRKRLRTQGPDAVVALPGGEQPREHRRPAGG